MPSHNHNNKNSGGTTAEALGDESQAVVRAHDQHVKALAQAYCDFYFLTSVDGTILDYSALDTSQIHLKPEDFLGKRLVEVVAPDVGALLASTITLVCETQAPQNTEYSLSMSGCERHYEARVMALPGTCVGVVIREKLGAKETESEPQIAESQYLNVFDSAVNGVFQTTPEGQYVAANPSLARIYGFDSIEDLLTNLTDIGRQLYVDSGRRKEFSRMMKRDGAVWQFESPIHRKDGNVVWISENARALHDESGQLSGYAGTVIDVTQRVQVGIALRESESKLRQVIEYSTNLFYTHTPGHVLTYVSPQSQLFFDCEPDEALRHWHEFCTDNPVNCEGVRICQRAIDTGQKQPAYELELRGSKGRIIWVEANEAPVVETLPNGQQKTTAIVGALTDITARKNMESELKHRAFHDSLTGLPNRTLFLDRCDQALKRRARLHRDEPGGVVVIFLDIDRFKLVNDSLGHDCGDALLKEAAGRIQSCLRPDDTAARLGGDEFIVLLENIGSLSEAIVVADRIAEILKQPLDLNGHIFVVTSSMGIVLNESSPTTAEKLMRDADVAMYRAKTNGRASYEIFDPEMNDGAVQRLQVESDLRQAIEREEFCLYYQPKFNLQSNQLVAFEALVRWNHPTRGLVAPGEFIFIAQEAGLILSIGDWVMKAACRQAQLWQEKYIRNIDISINISARQLHQNEFAQTVAQILKETEYDPKLLQLEITENVVMEDSENTKDTLRQLSEMGARLSIDDFGTGYSSLSFLRRFPIDSVKIDRSFVHNLGKEIEDTEIVRAIVSLAKALCVQVIAEGIETQEQLELLRAFGCDRGQGFLFAKPLPAEEAERLFLSGK